MDRRIDGSDVWEIGTEFARACVSVYACVCVLAYAHAYAHAHAHAHAYAYAYAYTCACALRVSASGTLQCLVGWSNNNLCFRISFETKQVVCESLISGRDLLKT